MLKITIIQNLQGLAGTGWSLYKKMLLFFLLYNNVGKARALNGFSARWHYFLRHVCIWFTLVFCLHWLGLRSHRGHWWPSPECHCLNCSSSFSSRLLICSCRLHQWRLIKFFLHLSPFQLFSFNFPSCFHHEIHHGTTLYFIIVFVDEYKINMYFVKKPKAKTVLKIKIFYFDIKSDHKKNFCFFRNLENWDYSRLRDNLHMEMLKSRN
jgi:hypothetical protein